MPSDCERVYGTITKTRLLLGLDRCETPILHSRESGVQRCLEDAVGPCGVFSRRRKMGAAEKSFAMQPPHLAGPTPLRPTCDFRSRRWHRAGREPALSTLRYWHAVLSACLHHSHRYPKYATARSENRLNIVILLHKCAQSPFFIALR
jgi:hypothetical protein